MASECNVMMCYGMMYCDTIVCYQTVRCNMTSYAITMAWCDTWSYNLHIVWHCTHAGVCVCKQTSLLREPLPRHPSGQTALHPWFGALKAMCPRVLLLWRGVCFTCINCMFLHCYSFSCWFVCFVSFFTFFSHRETPAGVTLPRTEVWGFRAGRGRQRRARGGDW